MLSWGCVWSSQDRMRQEAESERHMDVTSESWEDHTHPQRPIRADTSKKPSRIIW